jgi:hypothetical protein
MFPVSELKEFKLPVHINAYNGGTAYFSGKSISTCKTCTVPETMRLPFDKKPNNLY